MSKLSFWIHIIAQVAAQAVAFNLPEPAGKWVSLIAALAGATAAWYDQTHAKSQMQ